MLHSHADVDVQATKKELHTLANVTDKQFVSIPNSVCID